MHTTQCLCLNNVQECERDLWKCLARQSYHGCKQEGLIFEPAGRCVQMEAISRNRVSYDSLQPTVLVSRATVV